MMRRLGIRWTIGDVSDNGFEALRLSLWGAWRLFGASARYAVCANTLPAETIRRRAGSVPKAVEWIEVGAGSPDWLRPHLDRDLARSAAWGLAPPLRLFPDLHELSLDNDCILWRVPRALERWLNDDDGSVLVAEDVAACFGAFAHLTGPDPRSLGIRGLSPSFDLEGALRTVLAEHPIVLDSELDEKSLQIAALLRAPRVHVVTVGDVSICSPFPTHNRDLGACGAHFRGLNAKHLGWAQDGRPAEILVTEHWRAHALEVRKRVARAARISLSQPGPGSPAPL